MFSLKPIVKVLPKLFDHSDKTVRGEVGVCYFLVSNVFFVIIGLSSFELKYCIIITNNNNCRQKPLLLKYTNG